MRDGVLQSEQRPGANEQYILSSVRLGDWIGDVVSIRERVVRDALAGYEISANESADRLAVLGRDWRIHAHPSGDIGRVPLPADPDQGEALPHFESRQTKRSVPPWKKAFGCR